MNLEFNSLFIKYSKTSDDQIMGKITESQVKENLCYYYALVFSKVFGGTLYSIKLKDEKLKIELDPSRIGNHAFVLLNGQNYDYAHQGVELSELMGSLDLNDYEVLELNEQEFLNFWDVSSKELKNINLTASKIKKYLS